MPPPVTAVLAFVLVAHTELPPGWHHFDHPDGERGDYLTAYLEDGCLVVRWLDGSWCWYPLSSVAAFELEPPE